MSVEENSSHVNDPQVASSPAAAATSSAEPPAPTPAQQPAQQPTQQQPTQQTAPPTDDDAMPTPKLKIGSQRPGSDKVQAKAQIPSAAPPPPAPKKFPPPNKRHQLSPELEAELAEALGGMSVDEIVGGTSAGNKKEVEPESRHMAKVVAVHRDDVFVDFGERNQGVLSLTRFAEPPEPGKVVEVIVVSFDAEEGLYQLTMPGTAQSVQDWSDLREGAMVEARITGENKGGLECEVNKIRGFIPASQVSLYRVENFAQFVGETLLCVVTEANPDKRNLVLSRRAVLEREQAEAKEKLMQELAVGQVRQGTVRSIRDFGAFVDLGGVDGLLHVSQLSWARVKHPSEVLTEGQVVTVKIQKIDPQTGKLSLAMKELTESPWANIAQKYPARSTVEGTVSKIMEFGAFVQLEPGVEGLVHISELAHQRVWRTGDVVSEGQQVEAMVMSVDEEKQRISLSMKAVQAKPVAAKKEEPQEEEPETPPPPMPQRKAPLKGGLGASGGGDQFGLTW
jgi:small subunit ribosomal protein S1